MCGSLHLSSEWDVSGALGNLRLSLRLQKKKSIHISITFHDDDTFITVGDTHKTDTVVRYERSQREAKENTRRACLSRCPRSYMKEEVKFPCDI